MRQSGVRIIRPVEGERLMVELLRCPKAAKVCSEAQPSVARPDVLGKVRMASVNTLGSSEMRMLSPESTKDTRAESSEPRCPSAPSARLRPSKFDGPFSEL